MKSVLFTGGGGAGNEALFRLLQGRYDIHFADADPEVIHESIPPDHRHVIPYAVSDDFSEAVADLCMEIGVDLLIPGVDEELPKMAGIGNRSRDLKILSPSHDYISNTLDKLSAHYFLKNAGIDNPKTVSVDFVDEIGFPCIVKPRSGRGSRGVKIIGDHIQMNAYIQLSEVNEKQLIAQEILTGQEYTVMMAADPQEVLRAVVPVKVISKRGITIIGETELNRKVLDACMNIHNNLPTRGCYNIQLMLTEDGRIMPFEINPRVSTTLCLGVAAGIDPVDIFLNEQYGSAMQESYRDNDGLLPFEEGLRLRRYWYNHFVRR